MLAEKQRWVLNDYFVVQQIAHRLCFRARAHTHSVFVHIVFTHCQRTIYVPYVLYIYIRPASLSLFLMIADRLAVRFSAMNYSVNM